MPTSRLARTRVAVVALGLAVSVLACRGGGASVREAPRPSPPSEVPSAGAAGRQSDAPRRDLSIDERRGGHTLARHVGRGDEDLRERLSRDTRISAASTYTDRVTAERVVAEALAAQRSRVADWLTRQGRRPNLVIEYDGAPDVVIGRSLRRGRDSAEDCHSALVVLRWDEAAGDYFVLTSYPEARR